MSPDIFVTESEQIVAQIYGVFKAKGNNGVRVQLLGASLHKYYNRCFSPLLR